MFNCLLIYVCAIAKEYSDKLDYFTVINAESYNRLLKNSNQEEICVFNKSVKLCSLLHKTSVKRITSMRSCIGKDIELARTELVDDMLKSTKKIEIICGEPGVGKSVILKNIGLKKQGLFLFFIKRF